MPTIDERELEDFLVGDPDRMTHIGFEVGCLASIYRQFNLGSYGIADIVVIEPLDGPDGLHFVVHIVELKKGEVDVNTLSQACRYSAGFLHHWDAYWKGGVAPKLYIQPILVGSHVNMSEWVYINDYLVHIPVYTYSISLESGITFKEVNLRNCRKSTPHFSPNFQNVISRAMDNMEDLRLDVEARNSARMISLPLLQTIQTPAAEGVHGQTN